MRRQPAQDDSGLYRRPRVVVPAWWEWNARSGSEELTGSPGGYLEPFPRSETGVPLTRTGIRSASGTSTDLSGMLHDRNTAPRDVAKLFRLHPPRKRAILLTLSHRNQIRFDPEPAADNKKGYSTMMSTILTLIVMAIVFQGVVAVLDSILDTVGVNSMLKGLPVIGSNLTLIWAYLFVLISDVGGFGFGASTEVLGLSDFGTDIGTALAIVGFIPIKDAAISALGKGLAR